MQKIHSFKESLVTGKKGEQVLKKYLASIDFVDYVEDVSNDRRYQKCDVDFLVHLKPHMTYQGNDVIKVEIKTDNYLSGNFYYETKSCVETDSTGGFVKTAADIMLYYFIRADTLYSFRMPQYQAWFATNEASMEQYRKTVMNKRWDNTSTYTSVGYAYPISMVIDTEYDWVKAVEFHSSLYAEDLPTAVTA